MHFATIGLIWQRELRDLFRDRRTVIMIFVMPVVLYPLLGFLGYEFALGAVERPSVIGIAGSTHLPQLSATSGPFSPPAAAAWLALAAGGPECVGVDRLTAALTLSDAALSAQDYPPLLVAGQFPVRYFDFTFEARSIRAKVLDDSKRGPLETGAVDVLMVVPADFRAQLDAGGQPAVEVYTRIADERSRLAERRLRSILARWKKELKVVRFLRRGMPANFDETLAIRRPDQEQGPHKEFFDELSEVIGRFLPFMLIMWALAGALHPAIDLTAGEKERSTLETLLLSPAARGDIVLGKFLAVWVFSAASSLWNLAWLGGAAWLASFWLPFWMPTIISLPALLWSALITLWLAALFSAISMALGAYARSTKEGQYYLLPLFIVTMPLTFLPLVPGVELNLFYSLVPITGASLLLQRLLANSPEPFPWVYFFPVLASLIVCTWLSLHWAAVQFQREEVLFRDSEGVDVPRWLREVLRLEKAPPD